MVTSACEDVGGPLHAALAPCHEAVEVRAADQARARTEGDRGDEVAAGQDAAVDVHLGSVAHRVDHVGQRLQRD